MACIKCGAEIPAGAAYCPYCGKKQKAESRAHKRGNGQGSVYRRPNGRWVAIRTTGYYLDEHNKLHRRTASRSDFLRKTDAVEFLPLLGTEADTRSKTAKKVGITLRQMYELWEPTHKRSQSTKNCYAAGFRVFEDLWDTPVNEQDIDELQECLDSCELGRRSLENAKTCLGLVYKYGIPRGYVESKLNVAEYLHIDKKSDHHKSGLTADQLEQVRTSIGKVPYADYVYCNCLLGYRPSELIALDVLDYDRKHNVFTGGAKTEAGKHRVVAVGLKIQPIISQLIRDRISGPVFRDENGHALTIKKYRQIFYTVLDAAGIQKLDAPHLLTPHSCRHTFATLMKNISAADKDKMELIGHTSSEMLRYYQDVNYDDLQRIVDSF